ncbi:hypothetical protein MJO29_001886 [Puccinia striiformis f. sp. tritici]|nr:hypothetical protein MJO29_001886 [Puccinia striiformis f. sp. tritici]
MGALEQRTNPTNPVHRVIQDATRDPLRRGDPLSVEAQVAVGLYRLGHGSTYVTIGHIFNIGKETADNASARFVTAVLAKFRIKAISFPHLNNTSQWAEIEESFENKHGIPGIVGAIDGTHVPLRKPPNDRWKSWASIVFHPCQKDLGRHHANGWDMYLSTVANPANKDFNFIHSSTRMIVEQAFGRLKNQFRILLHAQLARPIRAHNNAFACMVLHNMLNKRGTMYLQVWENRSPDEARFAELHNTNDDNLTPQTPNGGQPTMASIRDQLRTQLCT